MIQARKVGQHQQALTLFRSLPESLQKEKLILLFRMQSALQISGAESLACVEGVVKRS